MAISIGTMRRIDRYAGAASLIILRGVVALVDALRDREGIAGRPVKVIMVQKYLGMGSIINALPLLTALRAGYPSARLVFVTFPEQQRLVAISGLVDEILVVDPRSPTRFVADMARVVFRLWRLKPEICIDLEFFSRFSAVMSALSGAVARVGFFAHFNLRSPLLTHPVSLNHYMHVSRAFLAMAEALGIDISPMEGKPPHLPSLRRTHPDYLDTLPALLKVGPYAIINPNTSALCPLRAWRPERFAEVIRHLAIRHPDLTMVLIGAPREVELSERLHSLVGEFGERVINLAGHTDFETLLAVIEGADLLVSNDSGPAHIAAAYGIPEVVLFGPETPVLYGPLNPRARTIYKGLYCSPCLTAIDNKHFDDCYPAHCMDGISVGEVITSIDDLLTEGKICHE